MENPSIECTNDKQETKKLTTTITHAFNVGEYIWPKAWRHMCACRQYKVIHITESGYILKQVDHKGRLWKETMDITREWEDNYERVPNKYIRKLEHKFNVGDKIYKVSDEDKQSYFVSEIIPDTGYKISKFFTALIIPFKDESLYEKIGEETKEEISLEDRKVIAESEEAYLNSPSYKLEETMTIDDLKKIIKDMDNKITLERFDYYTLLPYDKVMVRHHDKYEWKLDYFSHLSETGYFRHKFVCVGGVYPQCIPYIPETYALLGTQNKPNEYYIDW